MSFVAGAILNASQLNDLDIDSLVVDTDTLVVDKTNDRVGIGTTSPDKKLHVEGGMLLDAYGVGEDEGLFFREGFLTVDQPSITVWDMSNSGASPDGLSINSSDGIRFRENGGEVARFKDGQLGIGTPSPAAELDVAGKVSIIGGNVSHTVWNQTDVGLWWVTASSIRMGVDGDATNPSSNDKWVYFRRGDNTGSDPGHRLGERQFFHYI